MGTPAAGRRPACPRRSHHLRAGLARRGGPQPAGQPGFGRPGPARPGALAGPGRGGKPGPAALRGKALFASLACARCHPAPLYTDLKQYDVGTGAGQDAGKKFDTPTLLELWRTAPYLHDGSAATIREVLTLHNPRDEHGKTSRLTAPQLADLSEYLLSL